MFSKIRNELYDMNYIDLKKYVVLLSLLVFIISIYYLNNVYLVFLVYLFLLYLSTKFYNNMIKFLSLVLPFILFGFLVIHLIKFNIIKTESYIIFLSIIKVIFLLDYLLIIYEYFKSKKKTISKNNIQKRTFKELRNRNIDRVQELNKDYINYYIKENNINIDSDYYKVINDNFLNKSRNDLEEYIWLNYLRFYKNKKVNKDEFKIINFIYLLLHVIILLLIVFVR